MFFLFEIEGIAFVFVHKNNYCFRYDRIREIAAQQTALINESY